MSPSQASSSHKDFQLGLARELFPSARKSKNKQFMRLRFFFPFFLCILLTLHCFIFSIHLIYFLIFLSETFESKNSSQWKHGRKSPLQSQMRSFWIKTATENRLVHQRKEDWCSTPNGIISWNNIFNLKQYCLDVQKWQCSSGRFYQWKENRPYLSGTCQSKTRQRIIVQ